MPKIKELPREVAEPLVAELNCLFKTDEEAMNKAQKVAHLNNIREQFPGFSPHVDDYLVGAVDHLLKSAKQAQASQAEMREMLEKLGAEPWFPALYLGSITTVLGDRAMVLHGSESRVVAVDDHVALDDLQPGDEVLLGCERNVIRDKSPQIPAGGETAVFKGPLPDGRMLLASEGSEFAACPAGGLSVAGLKDGDVVRWRRNAWLAFEKLEAGNADNRYMLEEVAEFTPDQVGGQDENLRRLLSSLMVALAEPEKAATYGLKAPSILMVGPPGTGKTLMARITASMIAKRSGKKCRFAVVKPAEWENEFVGATQRAIRELFASLREAAKDGYCILFLDEVESIGRHRGTAGGGHSDKFLAAFLSELQGFHERTNIAIISASNRKDLMDPALVERLSDIEIAVNRPDMEGSRAILEIHLSNEYAFCPNGSESFETRNEVIQTAVSLLFSPNGDNKVAVIRFNDGKERVVEARELISGRLLEQIARQARQSALEREVETGDRGIRVDDIRNAAQHAIDRLRTTLTRHNAHAYLADLPQDLGIVSVEAARPQSDRATRSVPVES